MEELEFGCELNYHVHSACSVVLMIQAQSNARQEIRLRELAIFPDSPVAEYVDTFGNLCLRVRMQPGDLRLKYRALARLPETMDEVCASAAVMPPHDLPSNLLRFTLPSRYVESDKLLNFAWEHFGKVPGGWARAQAICEWVHSNVQYKVGSTKPFESAWDILQKREGVCRDLAHVVVALCRAFNMPARYSVAYLPEVDVPDDGLPMDFHAYAEVFLGNRWWVFDPYKNMPRRGRIFMATGLDATDTAFATIYGAATLQKMRVDCHLEGSPPRQAPSIVLQPATAGRSSVPAIGTPSQPGP